MPDDAAPEASLGVIRCECGGEMHPADGHGGRGAGLYTVECDECGGIGGVNAEDMTVYGAVDRLEIHGSDDAA